MSDTWRLAAPIAGATLVLDQFSKALIERSLPMQETWTLLPFLAFQRTYNTGAAFSLLHDAGGWQRPLLSVVSIAIMAWLAVWLHRMEATPRLPVVSVALVLGGAAGNLFDRLHTGAVADFIVLHYQGWQWPTFNVADTAITLGVVGLLWGLRNDKPTAGA